MVLCQSSCIDFHVPVVPFFDFTLFMNSSQLFCFLSFCNFVFVLLWVYEVECFRSFPFFFFSSSNPYVLDLCCYLFFLI
uniref:Uncharacterized protein n=1 Tax=Rhizophora mucronata TaxID=61149 RepID=A0A2P2QJD6_RHIMU